MQAAHHARRTRCAKQGWQTLTWQLQRRAMAGRPQLSDDVRSRLRVTSDQQHTFVIRVRNGKAEWVTIQAGQTVEGQVEVFGELQPGDQVVKTATEAIHSGE
jgi:hypothetical protein